MFFLKGERILPASINLHHSFHIRYIFKKDVVKLLNWLQAFNHFLYTHAYSFLFYIIDHRNAIFSACVYVGNTKLFIKF